MFCFNAVLRGYIKDCIEERKVAVKRLLKEKYETGYKEVETLRHLESHENIIRYFRSVSIKFMF